ncbi:hypothetical protein MLD38_025600 [Melastoma candidum]|uniref:Uncharacterized protein n=1 Tax=Melastoma candidum TaxID=119954 RepID=A0ACB9NXP3_9MYRT|nr:hypothetical protein MLD38_025600 [Melastoma candidum]
MGNEIEVENEIEAASPFPADTDHLQRWLSSSSSSAASSSSSPAVTVPLLPKMPNLHVSFVCKSVAKSVRFYEDILGFVLIKRRSSSNFEGAWLFNYGIRIHLLESEKVKNEKGETNPKDNHISFQCSDLKLLEKRLVGMGIEYVSAAVTEGGIQVEQIFFHDPDGYMVEICSCDNLPVLPISSCPHKLPKPSSQTAYYGSDLQCTTQVSAMIMDKFLIDMLDLSF